MDTRHLRAFLKIAETGSISRAAESLGLAQPSLSQQLLRLEDEVGVALFRRTARGVTLSDPGRAFLDHARKLLSDAEAAVEDLREFSVTGSGDVVLAMPWSLCRLAGRRVVEAFWTEAPNVALRLVEAQTGQIRGWLEAGKVDLGVLFDTSPFRNLSTLPLATEPLFLIGPPGRYGGLHAMAEISLQELAALPLILPGPQHGLRQLVEHAAARAHATLEVRMELDAMQLAAELVAGHSVGSILPLPAIEAEVAAGRVSIARIADGALTRTLCLARNAGRVVSHASMTGEALTLKVLAALIHEGAWKAEPAEALQRA